MCLREGGGREQAGCVRNMIRVSCVQMKGHIRRDEAEFQGRLEKVEPKGKRPVGAFETGKIEDGLVKMVAVGACGELTSRN